MTILWAFGIPGICHPRRLAFEEKLSAYACCSIAIPQTFLVADVPEKKEIAALKSAGGYLCKSAFLGSWPERRVARGALADSQ